MQNRLAVVTSSIIVVLAVLSPATTPLYPRDWNVQDTLAVRVRAMVDARRYREVLDQLPPLVAGARERGDSLQLGRLLCAQGQALLGVGEVSRARGLLDRAAALSEANADTLTWLTALGVEALALNAQGEFDESVKVIERQMAIARIARDTLATAFASMSMGFAQLNLGHPAGARESYERAASLFEAASDPTWRLTALTGLGRAHLSLGDVDEARRTFQTVRSLAREVGDVRSGAHAINNLAVIEYDHGDLELAASRFEQAYNLQLTLADPLTTVSAASNVALLRVALGDFESAVAILEQARDLSREKGARYQYLVATTELGNVRMSQQRYAAASVLYREVLRSAKNAQNRIETASGLVGALVHTDSLESALDVIRTEATLPRESDRLKRQWLTLQESGILMRLGQFKEATRLAHQLASTTEGSLIYPAACVRLARCLALGDRQDDAEGWFQTAVGALELRRSAMGSFTWQEVLADAAHPGIVDAAAGVFDPARATRKTDLAFDLLQRVKARTVLDRVSRPGKTAAPEIEPETLTGVQRRLRDGELMLDFHVGNERAILFAVTRGRCRLVTLPGQRSDFAARVGLFATVLGRRDENPASLRTIEVSQRALGDALLGEVADLVAGAGRLIVCADGYLNALPFGILSPGGAAAIVEYGDIVYLPAASLLGDEGRTTRSHGAVAVEGADRTLAGAAEEVDDLRRRFRGVGVVSGLAPGLADSLADKQLIHVAAHVDADDARPWHSGIRLRSTGRAGQRADDEPVSSASHLWASDILQLELRGRLAVLAACRSGQGRLSRGQGVQGLSTAFIVAGVPTVVATMWRVDDLTTRDLMREFYGGLSDGATVAAALRRAKTHIRSREATRHPYYWAGFVLVGQADTRILLEQKQSNRMLFIILGILVLAGGAGVILKKRPPA